MKIAVFADDNGQVLPFFAPGVVDIYSDDSGSWQCINQIPFDIGTAAGMKDIRIRVQMLASEFEDCKLLVVDTIKGIAKVALEEYGIGIWQYNGFFLLCLLDKIHDELIRIKEEQAASHPTPTLVGSTDDASYEINLGAILDNNCGLNSRDLLIPFVQNTDFKKLTIDCKHMPKWFETTMCLLKLNYTIADTEDGDVRIVVEPVDFANGLADRQRIRLSDGGGCSSGGCSSGMC